MVYIPVRYTPPTQTLKPYYYMNIYIYYILIGISTAISHLSKLLKSTQITQRQFKFRMVKGQNGYQFIFCLVDHAFSILFLVWLIEDNASVFPNDCPPYEVYLWGESNT